MSSHQRHGIPDTRINVSPAAWPVTCNSAPVAHEAEHRVNETRDLDPHARLERPCSNSPSPSVRDEPHPPPTKPAQRFSGIRSSTSQTHARADTCALTKLSRTEDKSRVWSCIPVSNLIQLPASDRRRKLAHCRCIGN